MKWLILVGKLVDIVATLLQEWRRKKDEQAGKDKLAKEIADEQKIREEIAADIRNNPELPDDLLHHPKDRGEK